MPPLASLAVETPHSRLFILSAITERKIAEEAEKLRLEAEREERERKDREREFEECLLMMAEEDYERRRLNTEKEERRKRAAAEEALRQRLGAEERMKEENERATKVVSGLKVQPTRKGTFGTVGDGNDVFEAGLSFASNVRFDPFTVNAWTYGSAANAIDSARETNVEEEDELPEAVRRAAEHDTNKIGDLSFLYETSDRNDDSYRSWPPVYTTTKVLWEQYFMSQLSDTFSIERARFEAEAGGNGGSMRQPSALERRRSLLWRLRASAPMGIGAGGGPPEAEQALSTLGGNDAGFDEETMPDMLPLPFGVVIQGTVEPGQYDYYHIELSEPGAILTVALGNLEGDADLLVSRASVPTIFNHSWGSTSIKQEKRVVVYPTDPNYTLGTYIAAVYADVRPCTYAIFAASSGHDIDSSDSMRRLDPIIRRLKMLGDKGTSNLLFDFRSESERVDRAVEAQDRAREVTLAARKGQPLVEASEPDPLSLALGLEIEEEDGSAGALMTGDNGDGSGASGDASADTTTADSPRLGGALRMPGDATPGDVDQEEAIAFEQLLFNVGAGRVRANNQLSAHRVSPAHGGAFPAPLWDEQSRTFSRASLHASVPTLDEHASMKPLDSEEVWLRTTSSAGQQRNRRKREQQHLPPLQRSATAQDRLQRAKSLIPASPVPINYRLMLDTGSAGTPADATGGGTGGSRRRQVRTAGEQPRRRRQ